MKSLAALDRPSWLSSSAWPWQPYLLSHHQGGIAVTDIGDGPAVLFVHVGSWSFVWRDVLLRLANDFRCVAIDAPGCGLSDRLSTPPTLAQAADAITSVIDALQLRDLTLVAHDLGGHQCACPRDVDAVRGRSALEPRRPRGFSGGNRCAGPQGVACLLPRCAPCPCPLYRRRRRVAGGSGRSATADHLRSVQRSAAVSAALERVVSDGTPTAGPPGQPLSHV